MNIPYHLKFVILVFAALSLSTGCGDDGAVEPDDDDHKDTGCIEYGDYMHWVSLTDTPGHAYAVAAAGDTVVVADAERGIQVIDASNPQNPVIIGSENTLLQEAKKLDKNNMLGEQIKMMQQQLKRI